METRAHHVLIGLFTVIVVTAALLFGLWLAKTSSDRAFHDYEVVFNEAVTGLSQGAAVQYNGIKVGDVTQLKLDPADPRRVLARIRLSADTPVKQDTHAKLALTGLTGLSVIQLSGGSPQSPALKGRDGQVGVIVADPSPLTKLLASGEDLMLNINEVMSKARQVLHQLALASRNANATLAQTEELARNANSLINGPGQAALHDMQASMASLQRTTATIDRLLSDNRDGLNSGLRGMAEIGPALIELRKTLESLQHISRRLDDNPSGYLLGRDRTREFIP